MTEETLGGDIAPPTKRKRSEGFFTAMAAMTCVTVVVVIASIVFFTSASGCWMLAALPFAIVAWACICTVDETG